MDETRNDRRVQRTHRLLLRALLELIQEKSYDKITVQEIVDRADVGRTTFYAHFRDKEDLLVGNIRRRMPGHEPAHDAAEDELDASALLPPVTGLLEHTAENYSLYRSLRGTDGLRAAMRAFADRYAQDSEERLQSHAEELRIPAATVGRFLSGALMALLFDWLDRGMPEKPEVVDVHFRRLAGRGLFG